MLTRRLARLAFRLRLRRAVDGALTGLTWGLGAAAILLAAGKLVHFWNPLALAGLAAGAGLLAGAAVKFSRRVSLRQVAALADLGAGSAEVISTAYEWPAEDRFGSAIHARAEAVLRSHKDSSLLPRRSLKIPWRATALALLLAVLVPIPTLTFASPPGAEIATISPQVLRALERSGKEMKRIGDQTPNPELSQIGEEMRRLAAAVQLGELSKKEALAKIAALTDRAEEARRELDAKSDALRALARNPETRPMAADAARGNADGAKSRAAELAKKAASGELDAAKMKSLKETLEAIAKEGKGELSRAAATAAKELAKENPKELPAALERLAKELKGAWVPEEMLGAAKAELPAGKELAEALKGLEDAEGDLMTEEQLAAALKEYCPDCGKKKDACKGGS